MTDPDKQPEPQETLAGLLEGTEERTERVEAVLKSSDMELDAVIANVRLFDLNMHRIAAQEAAWRRAGRLLYRAEASGDTEVKPSNIIAEAEKGENA